MQQLDPRKSLMAAKNRHDGVKKGGKNVRRKNGGGLDVSGWDD
jgi:hypothetical protein